MRFLVPVGGVTEGVYGIITAPNHKGVPAGIKAGLPWAADLGCLIGPSFVKRASVDAVFSPREVKNKKGEVIRVLPSWVEEMRQYKATCLFLAGFDVVGNAQDTIDAYEEISTRFIDLEWPVAYIAQNGAENLPIPDSCAAVFIGGVEIEGRTYTRKRNYDGHHYPLDWKESLEAVSVIKRAQAMGKHIHIGRVNHGRKYDLFNVLAGSELFTCDGTRTQKDGTEKTLVAWAEYEQRQMLLKI